MVTFNGKTTNKTYTMHLKKEHKSREKSFKYIQVCLYMETGSPKMLHSERQLLCTKPANKFL